MKEKFYTLDSDIPGFAGLWTYGQWKIAMMNDAPHLRYEALGSISKHLCTDEAFVLLEGSATMYIGDGDDEVGSITRFDYEKGKLYVVAKGTWHQIRTYPGTKLLIVEQADTSPDNSVTVPLAEKLPE